MVRDVRARLQHVPRIRREAIVFRGPPDRSGPMLSTLLCSAKAYETRTTQSVLPATSQNVTCSFVETRRRPRAP